MGLLQTILPVLPTPDVAQYMQKDMDHLFQTFFQALKGRFEDKFKAKTLDVYYNRSHIECYNFCQLCEEYFTTCGATESNQIPFAAFFLQDRINFCLQQHKWTIEGENSTPIFWDKFKIFLCKALGDFRAFINNY